MPFVTARSLSEYGTPQIGPAVPSAQAAEARCASARARSAVTVTNAFMAGLQPVDPRQRRVGHLDRVERAARVRVEQLGGRQRRDVVRHCRR